MKTRSGSAKINKERKPKYEVSSAITKNMWDEHFKKLLYGKNEQ